MRGVEKEFDDVDAMIKDLGAQGAAEAFIKAREYFEANKDGEAEDDRPKPMTAAEWRSVLEEDNLDEGLLMEGEEEDLDLDDIDEDIEEEGEEPPSKKAKTD